MKILEPETICRDGKIKVKGIGSYFMVGTVLQLEKLDSPKYHDAHQWGKSISVKVVKKPEFWNRTELQKM
jgi:hypothetical protein